MSVLTDHTRVVDADTGRLREYRLLTQYRSPITLKPDPNHPNLLTSSLTKHTYWRSPNLAPLTQPHAEEPARFRALLTAIGERAGHTFDVKTRAFQILSPRADMRHPTQHLDDFAYVSFVLVQDGEAIVEVASLEAVFREAFSRAPLPRLLVTKDAYPTLPERGESRRMTRVHVPTSPVYPVARGLTCLDPLGVSTRLFEPGDVDWEATLLTPDESVHQAILEYIHQLLPEEHEKMWDFYETHGINATRLHLDAITSPGGEAGA